ncbi:DUF1702 family protein [Coleofasciculus sp. E2-BRE-01]|uniref:DUF1702 family protein n=1 Tax=Coleofasciculus sp. E2-BRE-01 TaxID=3069524 RepID=UPI00330251B2
MLQTLTKARTDRVPSLNSLRKSLLSISPEEATFARRGFQCDDAQTQQQLERVGHTFLQGYHSAIAYDDSNLLLTQLNTVSPEWRGFAFEGAAMGLALLDGLTPWKGKRVERFLGEAGANHTYMVHVGVGWAIARLPWLRDEYLAKLDPLLSWLAIDGYGFHQGYFYGRDFVTGIAIPKRLSGYAGNVFDQGLGRSIWFVNGADLTRIPQTLENFPPVRRADLWSGIGLACTYAGGVDSDGIAALKIAAGEYQPELAQGAAFAAKTRLRARNLTAHTQMACQVLWGMSAEAAAEITDIALQDLPKSSPAKLKGKLGDMLPAYEIWRRRIQAQF